MSDPFRGNGVWAVTDILTDLIAELWDYRDSPDGNKILAPIIERAETRLREVQGE